MLDTDATLPDMLQQTVVEYLTNSVYTSLPAIVTKVDDLATKQTIDAQVAINRTFEDGKALTGAQCADVPVIFPSAGGGLLSFPIKVGDTVLLCFSKRSIDEWAIGNGEATSPDLNRQFSVADAIAIPGLYTTQTHLSPDPDNVQLKFAGSDVTLYSDGNARLSAAKDATVMAAGNINLNAVGDVNITAGGDVNVSGATINLN